VPAVQHRRKLFEQEVIELVHLDETLVRQAPLLGRGDPGLGGFQHSRDHLVLVGVLDRPCKGSDRVARVAPSPARTSSSPPRRQRHRHPTPDSADGRRSWPRPIRPHASLGTTDQIVDTLDNLGLLLRQVEERTFPDPLDADPRSAYHRVLEYSFVDQLRTAPNH
jgi:hypothetical protein